MCGILAVVGGPMPVSEAIASDALTTLRHRGPDDSGIWQSEACWLGSRRLAILDPTPRGHQPMADPESGAVVVFNGEIYNYIELRRELEEVGARFSSGCDTEVLLKAYLQWGYECVARFNGMWAFVVWDPRSNTAFFARDRFGVKPFVYTAAGQRLAIASEPKALTRLFPELARVDERSLYEFLALGKLHSSTRSMYAAVSVLPPAHAGTFRVGDVEPVIWKYWDFPTTEQAEGDPTDQFRRLLEDAVRVRLRSDVPLGVTVSGGLDSTAILHAAASALPDDAPPLQTFTSIFANHNGGAADEREWALEASRRYKNVVLERVPVTENWLEIMQRLAWHLDAPTYSPAAISLWTIMEYARAQGVKVLLEGQGGDELLGGYLHHAALAFLGKSSVNGARSFPHIGDFRAYARTFPPHVLAFWILREQFPSLRHLYRAKRGSGSTLRSEFASRLASTAPPDERPPARLRDRLIADLSRDILPALLHYGDAVSMAHSIETRQPFLDFRLVEYCTTLPDEWKVARGETKRALRAYLRAVGQERIAARTDKLGFPTPVWRRLVDDDASLPRTLLLGPDARLPLYCSRHAVGRLIDRTRHEKRAAYQLFRLLSTESWLRACIA